MSTSPTIAPATAGRPPLLPCARCGQPAVVDNLGIRCLCAPDASAAEVRRELHRRMNAVRVAA